MTRNVTTLATVQILYRDPGDSLALWGILYNMRPGQQPRDIARGHAERSEAAERNRRRGTPDAGPPELGWIWLGCPGWYGDMPAVEIAAVKVWLAPLEAAGVVPGNPGEWCELNPTVYTTE